MGAMAADADKEEFVSAEEQEAGDVEIELEDDVEVEEEGAAEPAGEDAEVEVEDEAGAEAEAEPEAEADVEEEEEAEPAEPAEPEIDDAEALAKLKRIARPVAFSTRDATPNVFFSAGGVLSALSQGPFAKLLSGARADVGVKDGRYLFEVQVLELAPSTKLELRVGFGLARSSLFLGDGSAEGIGFGRDGTYFVAEPGQLSCLNRKEACQPMGPKSIIGVLLNLDPASKTANTISLFLDGERAGRPQPIPSHLRGKALFPTITFRGLSLAVNFGHAGLQLRPLPFACTMLGQMAEAHQEPAPAEAAGRREVVVPVGLPEAGFFDCVQRFRRSHPDFVELSDREVFQWCTKSGLKRERDPGLAHSVDKPDFAFGHAPLDGKAWREPLLTLAHMTGRSCVAAELCGNLLRTEREALLKKFPASVKKVALVAVGEPSEAFRQWVHQVLQADYEEKKALVERKRLLAEASGVALGEDAAAVPEPPKTDDSTTLLPRKEPGVPDVSQVALAQVYAKFSLPAEDEGFDEVRYEWLDKAAAEKHLRAWVVERKATFIITDLKPGAWFQARLELWKQERKKLRETHLDYDKRRKAGTAQQDPELHVDLASIVDIHDADGRGTPLYAAFKYEDWLLLSWRFEMHLLAHAFLEDAADEDIPGIPENHVHHYFELYFGLKCLPKDKLGVDGIAEAVRLLREPVELVEGPKPGHPRTLQSKLERDTPLATFVKGVEGFRRDRKRRLEAGDESAQLSFPKPAAKAPAPGKAPPGKAAPPKAKAAPPKALPAKAAPPKAHPAKAMPGSKPMVLAKAPLVKAAPGRVRPPAAAVAAGKAPITKAAPAGAKAPITKAAPPGAVAAGLKRPAPPGGPPAEAGGAPWKKPRPPAGLAAVANGKAPIAKRKPVA